MAGRNLKREIVITANGKGAESVLTVLKKHMKDLHDQMEQLEKDGKANTKEYRELQKTYKQLDQQTKQQTFEFERYDKVMRNLSGSSVRQLRQALKALKKEMELYSSDDPHLDILRNKIKAVQDQINEATGAVQEHGNSWQDALKGMVAFAAGFEVLDTLKDKLQQVIEKTFEFGDAQASVKKVTGLNDMGIADLSARLAKMDTRTTLTDLHNLAYEGGKLGIGEYGVQGLESYVRAANQIKVALGDDLGEDAMLPLAKMGEVMGLFNGTAESVEKGILQIGSAINELTQSSASSAGAIVDFGARVQGMAAYLKLSTADMLALGSAADAAGLSMETSGTSFSMFLSALQKSPGAIEKALKIEDGTINQLVNSGKTMDAILLILDKMKEAGNMHNLEDAFKALGSEGARMVGVLATMSQKVDMVRDHVDVSRQAFREATSVTNEYNVQNETAAAIMERANNMWNNLFVNTEGVDNVKGMAQTWYDLSKAITTNSVVMASAKMTLEMLRLAIQGVITLLPVLLTLLMTNGLMKAFSVLGPMVVSFGRTFVANFTLIRAALEGSTMAAGRLTIAWRTMTLAMKANVIMLAVSVVAELAYAIYNLTQKTDEAHNAVVDFSKDVADAGLQSAAAEAKVRRFADQIERAGKNEKERNRAIAAFNKQFGQYMSHLLTEKSAAKDVADAYAEVVKNMRAKALLEAKQKGQKTVDQKYVESRNRSNRFEDLTKGTNNEMYDRDWLEQYIADARKAGKTAEQVSKEIGRKLGGMTDMQIGNIWQDNRGESVLGKVRVGKSGTTRKATVEEQQLHAAIRTVLQSYAAENAQKKLDYTYKGLDTNIGGPEAEVPDEIANTETEAERKKRLADERKAAAASRKEQNDQMREWRDQLKQKQDEANALFENINNFYDRQINAKMQEAVDLGLDESEQKLFIEPLRKKRNEVMEQAYLAVAGQRNTLNDLIKDMGLDLLEVTDETGVNLSESLLSAIEETDVSKIRTDMIDLAQKIGKPMQDVMADVFAKAAKSAQKNLQLEIAQMEARRKVAQERDYVGVAQTSAYDDFNLMGYANPTKQEASDKAAFEKRKQNIIAMYEQARKELPTLLSIDVESEQGRGLLMQLLFGKDENGMGERITKVLGDDAEQWRLFYEKLIHYNDAFAEAQQKSYNEAKKTVSQTWKDLGFEDSQKRREQEQGHQSRLMGDQHSFGSRLGFTQQKYDPEVEGYKQKLEFAKEYYDFVMANSKNVQLQQEAQIAVVEAQNALTESMVKQMHERADMMKQFSQPIVDFGSAAGEALAQFSDDVDSAQEALRNAVRSMLKSWGEMMINNASEQMMQGIKNGMTTKVVKNEKKPDVASTVTESVTDGLTETNPLDDLNAQAQADMAVAIEEGKYERIWEIEAEYQEQSLMQWKAYADMKREILGEAPEGGNSVINQKQAENDALLEQQEKQNKAMINLHNIGQSAANDAIRRGLNYQFKIRKKANDAIAKDDKNAKDAQVTDAEQTEEQKKQIFDAGATVQLGAQQALNAKVLTANKAANAERVQGDAATTEAETTLSIVEAMAKCFSFLGPIAGPIMAGVVQGLLMGLLQWGLSKALGSGSDKKTTDTKTPNTKLVSGMLTYDKGNVQTVIGDDGKVYEAVDGEIPAKGVNLLTEPTIANVNGQRAIIAEQGPEFVIGRETSKALMMRPDLLSKLQTLDAAHSGRSVRTFDRGNVGEVAAATVPVSFASDASSSTTADAETRQMIAATMSLLQRLEDRLSQPIQAKVNMWGDDGLWNSNKKAQRFMRGKE